jgi:hypothetical protein
MRPLLSVLVERLRRRRTARRQYQAWTSNEPVVPTLRDWPVERRRR